MHRLIRLVLMTSVLLSALYGVDERDPIVISDEVKAINYDDAQAISTLFAKQPSSYEELVKATQVMWYVTSRDWKNAPIGSRPSLGAITKRAMDDIQADWTTDVAKFAPPDVKQRPDLKPNEVARHISKYVSRYLMGCGKVVVATTEHADKGFQDDAVAIAKRVLVTGNERCKNSLGWALREVPEGVLATAVVSDLMKDPELKSTTTTKVMLLGIRSAALVEAIKRGERDITYYCDDAAKLIQPAMLKSSEASLVTGIYFAEYQNRKSALPLDACIKARAGTTDPIVKYVSYDWMLRITEGKDPALFAKYQQDAKDIVALLGDTKPTDTTDLLITYMVKQGVAP